MTTGVWVLIGLMAVVCILFVVAADRLERKHQIWDEYYHPPDSVRDEDGKTSSGAAAPPSPFRGRKGGDDDGRY